MDPLVDTVEEGVSALDVRGAEPDVVLIAKDPDQLFAETNDVDGDADLLLALDVATDIDDGVQVAAAIDDGVMPLDVFATGEDDDLDDLLSLDLLPSGPLVAPIATDYDEQRALVAASKYSMHGTAADHGGKSTMLGLDLAAAASKHGMDDSAATDHGGESTMLRIDLAPTPNDGIFPLDVTCEILLRVPSATSICRFRCVSNSWRSLLRHPKFIAAHRARHPPAPLIAATVRVGRSDGMAMGVNLLDTSGNVVKKIRSHAAVTGCSLYGMCAHRELACLVGTDRRLHVLDMATGAVAAYPPRPRGALTCTLGRVPFTGEYKILTIVNQRHKSWGEIWNEQMGMVLTLGSNGGGRWRDVESPPVMLRRGNSDVAVVKGVACFSMKSCLGGHEQEGHVIVEFDLGTEQWLPGPYSGPPAGEDVDHRDMSLAEVNDFLVAAHHYGHRASAVKLWFLMESTETTRMWYPLYTIAMPDHGASRFRFEKPLRVMEDGKIVVWVSSTTDGSSHDGTPQIYDPKTETFTEGAAVTRNCYAVGSWTGCLLRLGSSDPRSSHKTLELLDDAESSRWHALTSVDYVLATQLVSISSSLH